MAVTEQRITTVTVSADQKVFLIPCGAGRVSCFGFNNCFAECQQLARILDKPEPAIEQLGTLEQYQEHQDLVSEYAVSPHSKNTWFDPGTPEEVKKFLDVCRVSGTKVRIWYGDPVTGLSWLDEYDVIGHIGRTMGPLRAPIMLRTKNSMAGVCILTACVIRIMDTKLHRNLYKHPKFHNPEFLLGKGDNASLPWEVYLPSGIGVHRKFPTEKKRDYWLQFMNGERFVK